MEQKSYEINNSNAIEINNVWIHPKFVEADKEWKNPRRKAPLTYTKSEHDPALKIYNDGSKMESKVGSLY